MQSQIKYIIFSIILISVLIVSSCDKESSKIDQELYEMAKVNTGFVWYKNSAIELPRSSSSGHSNPYLKTRYNLIASSNLDSTGKVKSNSTFPTGSLIVKELIGNANNIERYAIMYKMPDNEFADENGWVWGYINADGSVAEKASNVGKACIGCHKQAGNIDLTLMNYYFL